MSVYTVACRIRCNNMRLRSTSASAAPTLSVSMGHSGWRAAGGGWRMVSIHKWGGKIDQRHHPRLRLRPDVGAFLPLSGMHVARSNASRLTIRIATPNSGLAAGAIVGMHNNAIIQIMQNMENMQNAFFNHSVSTSTAVGRTPP